MEQPESVLRGAGSHRESSFMCLFKMRVKRFRRESDLPPHYVQDKQIPVSALNLGSEVNDEMQNVERVMCHKKIIVCHKIYIILNVLSDIQLRFLHICSLKWKHLKKLARRKVVAFMFFNLLKKGM